MSVSENKKLLSTGRAAALLQERHSVSVSQMTIRNWCALYQIGRKVGGRWFVDVAAMLAHLGLEGAR